MNVVALARRSLAPAASPCDAPVAGGGRAFLKADRLTVRFRGTDGRSHSPLVDFNLSVRRGEITCILGASGSGKTTLLRALGGFVPAEPSGGVLLEDRFLDGPTTEIVMIFQENNLFPWLTVRGNIGFGLRYRPGSEDAKATRLARMIETVGLADAAERYPHQLSGGMRQRAAIARALVIDPRVLLLDEPFSALDVTLRRRMNELMIGIWRDLGTTMVMVTHNVEEALLVGHRVIVLGGRPATILLDEATDDDVYKDRYSPSFLSLQRRIESLIE